jgi:hypothetical protein
MLSVVGIVIGLGVGRPKNRGSIPGTGTNWGTYTLDGRMVTKIMP